ncbi:MAG TPA: zinc-ribbon domain-containing protein [Massilibacterium sp.]|nr:zinc-ribbon domain-containing protein [Massilibacterium sp.]
MNCPHCGKEISSDSKFCYHCGGNVQQSKEQSNHTDQQTILANNEKLQEYSKKGKEAASNYWGYLLKSIKYPEKTLTSVERSNSINGYIGIILFVLVLVGTSLILINIELNNQYYGMTRYMDIPYFEIFAKLSILFLLLLFLNIALIWFTVKVILKTEIDFHSIVAKFGVLTSVSLLASVLFFILTVIGVPFNYTIVLYTIFLLIFQIGTYIIIQSSRNDSSKIDTIYAYLIQALLFSIVLVILVVYTELIPSVIFNL